MSPEYYVKIAKLLKQSGKFPKLTKSFDYSDMENTMQIIVPQHEQNYPSKILSRRLEEYVRDDGKEPTENRAFAKLLTGKQVLDEVVKIEYGFKELNLNNINPRYFVGTCFHESGCSNEWDTEIASPSSIHGFQSVGAYQIGLEETERYGFNLRDMLDIHKATICMVRLAEDNRNHIRLNAHLSPNDPDPDYTDDNGDVWKGGTMRAYLAICHNHGSGYVAMTIRRYGMDWGKYKIRNPTDNIVAHGYGEDCITGGANYPKTAEPEIVEKRLLRLTKPFMTGEDVRELQRHLKITTDGVFGPDTELALIKFQKSNDFSMKMPRGVCDQLTWDVLLTK